MHMPDTSVVNLGISQTRRALQRAVTSQVVACWKRSVGWKKKSSKSAKSPTIFTRFLGQFRAQIKSKRIPIKACLGNVMWENSRKISYLWRGGGEYKIDPTISFIFRNLLFYLSKKSVNCGRRGREWPEVSRSKRIAPLSSSSEEFDWRIHWEGGSTLIKWADWSGCQEE